MADNSIDDSQVGQLLINALSQKNGNEARESEFKKALLDRVVRTQRQKSENPQKVLDSQFFNGLSLSEKIDFINNHRDLLSHKPSFNWGNLGTDILASASLAGTGTLLHQIVTNAGKAGFKANPWALGTAVALGGMVGGTISASRERKDYKKDLDTQRNIDDAISILVDRSLRPVPTRVDYLNKVKSHFEEIPLSVGKSLSSVDFDKI